MTDLQGQKPNRRKTTRYVLFLDFTFMILVKMCCWWLDQLLGKSYGWCVNPIKTMTALILKVTRTNMISFIQAYIVSHCGNSGPFLYDMSESCGSRLWRDNFSSSRTDSCWSLCWFFVVAECGSILSCFYQCQKAAWCPFSDGIPAGKDLVIKADRCSQSFEK